ncbi:RNA-binding protein [Stygiolobus caldivivus]|uniref:RNA-binding protein n=2 Tax=Stygiolobus caldivivus TaxID=2824673 RepID=A0A8D5ZJP5_9CREN|nr:RNA-binding protein [Stygiolobus caldivivus]
MSYIDLLAWYTENKDKIEGCRIDNIFKIEGLEAYLFKLYCKGEYKNLVLEPGKRIHFTKYERQKLSTSEVSILRELLRDRIIREISILGSERIIKIVASEKTIYLELLPRGLLVITDENNRILFSTEYKEFKDRVIKLGLGYTPPPSFKPPTKEEIEKLLKKNNLSRVLGVPQEIIEALNIKAVNESELEEAKKKVDDLIKKIVSGNFEKCLLKGVTVLPVKVEHCIQMESYNDALDEFFTAEEKDLIKSEIDKKLEEDRKKLEKTIEDTKRQIEEYEKKAEELRSIAQLIVANYDTVNTILAQSNKRNTVKAVISGVEVELDPTLTVYKNSSKYYDMAKEYIEKAKKAKLVLNELQLKMEELEKQIIERKEEILVSSRKKEWYEKYHWSITRNGFLVIAGRDVDQNESIVRKLLEDRDIFLHSDIQGAAATVLKTEGREPKEEDIVDAATISACYSKAWKSGMASIDVFWVYGDQVSKSPPSGEYLKKGSFMIYGKKNYIKNVKLELAVGLLRKDNEIKIIVGNTDNVSSKTDMYVVVSPGDEDPSKLGEKIIKYFHDKFGIQGLKAIKEDLIREIPGKSRILMKKIKT